MAGDAKGLLNGKVCLVVGAGSPRGIGFATAKLFANHGARVMAADLTLAPATEQALRDGAPDLATQTCDIRNADSCARLVAATLDRFGRLDALVNCAGIVQAKGMLAIDAAEFDRMTQVNLAGTFSLNQAVLRHFTVQGAGVIVNLASVAAQRGGGLVGGAHYAASKGGVVSLTRAIAREFGPQGVRANVVCPSMTETGMLDGLSPAQFAAITDTIPLRRAATPGDIAGVCLFLASDLSAYVTGATLDVNGGSHIH